MSKHKNNLSGIFPPNMTPFKDQKVDYRAVAYNVEKYNQTKMRGYMPLGSNGEFRSLSDAESLRIVKITKQHAAPDKVLMVGAGRESAYQTVEFIKRVADLGADYASVLTPHYYASKMNDDALIAYYNYIGDRSPIPILMYCAPSYAGGVLISPAAVAKLAKHPNIVGMKDTSKEDIALYTSAVPKNADFYVLAGSISKFFYGLTVGGIGGVLSMANYFPGLCCELYQLFLDGKLEQAQKMSDELNELNKKTAGKGGVAGVKACMDLLGFKGRETRLPLLPLDAQTLAGIKDALITEGYIKK